MTTKELFKNALNNIKCFLQRFSFKTGIIVLFLCVPFYILSFAQMLLPISLEAKGILWFILYGLAKATQYAGLTIIGAEGLIRLKNWWKSRK